MVTMWRMNFKSINQKQKIDRGCYSHQNQGDKHKQKHWRLKGIYYRNTKVTNGKQQGEGKKGKIEFGFQPSFGPLGVVQSVYWPSTRKEAAIEKEGLGEIQFLSISLSLSLPLSLSLTYFSGRHQHIAYRSIDDYWSQDGITQGDFAEKRAEPRTLRNTYI